MTRQYLLDTNTSSYIINGKLPAARRRLARHDLSQIAVSVVTEGELRFGVARRPAAIGLAELVEAFLCQVTILPWESPAAATYAHLRAKLERDGKPLGALDMMIAAHALSLDLVLVTSDRAFGRVPDLVVEDWTKP